MVLNIRLPWPEERLWPNRARKLHWSKKVVPAREARDIAYVHALEALNGRQFDGVGKRLYLRMYFMTLTRHRFDLDGAFSAMKWYIDGIADALTIDDSAFVDVRLVKTVDVNLSNRCVDVCVGVVE